MPRKSDLSPEYQEIIRLYDDGKYPKEIANRTGLRVKAVKSALQYLRSIGAVDSRSSASPGRPPNSTPSKYLVSGTVSEGVEIVVDALTAADAARVATEEIGQRIQSIQISKMDQ